MRVPSFILLLALTAHVAADTISLEGRWGFELDPADRGEPERWFARELRQSIRLPGSLQAEGFGNPVTLDTHWTGDIVDRSWFKEPRYEPYRQPGNLKIPFWLQPDTTYTGAAWYQREFEIPANWAGRRILLFLERPHWQTTVWVGDQPVGTQDSLSVPHAYDLSEVARPGRHRLTLRVDNRMIQAVGVNAHSVSDHTQGNWNGVVGELKLVATDRVWIEDTQIYPDAANRAIRVRLRLGNTTGRTNTASVTLEVTPRKDAPDPHAAPRTFSIALPPRGTNAETSFDLGPKAALWSEFNPALYTLKATVDCPVDGSHLRDLREVPFGVREVRTAGTQITVNGRPTFLRGTLECCIFPLTGYPPTDVAAWKRILHVARAHGLNHLRFHSWCPPEAAFQAADETGFYYYVECPLWANQGSTIGDGRPLDRWVYDEGDRILQARGNHPSFILMSHGNEPAGTNQNRFLGELVLHWRRQDPRRLYTSGAGWPAIPENDVHVTPTPRIQAWGQGLDSRINARPPETVTDYRDDITKAGIPVISHEIGQWCVYPNFDEIRKYTGHLKAKNFEIFRDSLSARGLLELARPFLIASGKLQTLCYKEDIESALRTPGMAGFELLDLHDFPGQGTALVGVLDAFWDSKGYVTPAEFHRFCSSIVPLARLPKRILTTDDALAAQVEIAQFGPRDLARAEVTWRIRDARRRTLCSGTFPARPIPAGLLAPVGDITVPVRQLGTAPAALNLEVAIAGTPYANDWDLWIYPSTMEETTPANVSVVESLDASTLQRLEAGATVLWLPPPATIRGDELGRVKIGFSSIFWNTAWTARQAPHTLGILCDPGHPALARFPTESHSNWQWQELVSRAHPFLLNDTPPHLKPIVYAIDDWVTNRKLGLVFETRVGRGKLLACGIDLSSDLDRRPVARQLRRSLLAYAASRQLRPVAALDPEQVRALVGVPGSP